MPVTRPRRSPTACLAAVAALALAPLPVAAGATISGTAAGGAIPASGAGIRAVNVLTGQIGDAARLPRGGRFSLRVPPGPYTLLTTIAAQGRVRRSISPVVWPRRAAARVRVAVSLRRTRTLRPRAVGPADARRAAAARALQTIPAPVVAVRSFLVQGPDPHLGPGLADVVLGALVDAGTAACRPRVVEWERRADVQRERDLWRSRYVDRSSVPRGRPLRPQVFVEGFITQEPDGTGSYQVLLVDAATGRTLGGDHGSVPARGDRLAIGDQIAGHLADQLCGGAYDVTLAATTTGVFATHTATGALNATLTATPTALGGPGIGTSFFGSGPLGYRDNVFTSAIGCSYTDVTPLDGNWGISLEVTDQGRLRVTWLPDPGGPRVTAGVACPDAPVIPGQPGANLVGAEPARFEIPVAGGSVDVTGGVREGTDGWTHRGVLVIRRVAG